MLSKALIGTIMCQGHEATETMTLAMKTITVLLFSTQQICNVQFCHNKQLGKCF